MIAPMSLLHAYDRLRDSVVELPRIEYGMTEV